MYCLIRINFMLKLNMSSEIIFNSSRILLHQESFHSMKYKAKNDNYHKYIFYILQILLSIKEIEQVRCNCNFHFINIFQNYLQLYHLKLIDTLLRGSHCYKYLYKFLEPLQNLERFHSLDHLPC